STENSEKAKAQGEVVVLEEDNYLREENIKHFKLSDGTTKAVVYPQAVHYKDADGKWIDIDNALTLNGSDYLSSNKSEIKFANKSGSNGLVSIKDGDYKIDFTPINANKVGVSIQNPQRKNSRKFEDVSRLNNLVSKAIYADIYDAVDIEYILVGNNIKENIIVNQIRDNYSFSFELKLNNLSAELVNGAIILSDYDSGEQVYKIPVPYMLDANNAYSQDVEYSLTQLNKWKYTLTVTADSEWINSEERAFPVTIDPTLRAPLDGITDTHTTSTSGSTDNSSLDSMYVGNHSWEGNSRAYIKLNSLPALPSGAILTNAKLCAYNRFAISASNFRIGVFKITSDWSPTTISYNYNYNYLTEEYPVDYIRISSVGNYEWDITKIAKGWYYSQPNYGVCLKSVDQSVNAVAILASSEAEGYVSPNFELSYISVTGIEDYYQYFTSSAGMAGTGYVNSFTGNLSFVHNLFTTADEIMPYNLFFTINSNNGWILSIDESVVATSQEYVYKWIDADGTIHYFSPEIDKNLYGDYVYYEYLENGTKQIAVPPTTFYDEDGLGLKLTTNESGNYVISDDKGNKKTFDSNGLLYSITDTYGNVRTFARNLESGLVTISLTPKNLSTIEQLTIEYGMTTITVTNKQTGVKAIITRGNAIESVEYQFTATSKYNVSFEYNSDYRLILAKDNETQRGVRYTYTNGGVTGVEELSYAENTLGDVGQKAKIIYVDGETQYSLPGPDNVLSTIDDITTGYGYDYRGRVTSVYTGNSTTGMVYGTSNYAYNDKYIDEDIGIKTNNSLKSVLTSGRNSVNLIKNPSFEIDVENWVGVNGSISARTPQISLNLGLNYGNALRISRRVAGTTAARQTVYLPAGDYNLSASFTKASMIEGSKMRLRVYNSSGGLVATTQDNLAYTVESTVLKQSWEKGALGFSAVTAGNYTISIEFVTSSNEQSIIYVDDVMLERGKGLSTYSAYENGDFEQSTESLTFYNASVVAQGGIYLSKGVKIDSNINDIGYVKYRYYTSSGFDIENWVISAWGQAPDCVASTNKEGSNAQFGIMLVANYLGTTETQSFLIPFNPQLKNWQYVCQRLAVSPDYETIFNSADGGQLESIDIYLCYNNNVGSAYFDSVSITRSGNYTGYTYNELGNISKVTTSNGDETEYNYYGNAIDANGIVDSTGNRYELEYDENHNLTELRFNNKIDVDYEYNTQGQAIKATSQANNKSIITSTSYVADIAQAYYSKTHTVTDELGNTTKYFYYNNGLLKGVCDSSNNGIIYEYNSYGELICAKLAVWSENDGLTEVTSSSSTNVDYSYNSEHELQTITSESTKYSFKYDKWGNTIGIYIDNPDTAETIYDSPLAVYDYEAGNGNLNKLTYGNGVYVEYTYDEIDRMIGTCYNGITKTEYVYSSNGQLSSIVDVDNNTQYQYYYDGDGRLINEREVSGNTTTQSIIYKYDENERLYQKWTYFPDSSNSSANLTTYTYNDDGTLRSVDHTINKISYTYDNFGRVTQKELKVGTDSVLRNEYSYFFGADWNAGTTNLINSITTTLPNGSQKTTLINYDELGNIIQIFDGQYYTYYHYDEKNQLVA
ncbi:MAG: RHS repeat protein, partial [Clostridia bacterium]|nr:RHS repeat protein [Clostridia bacterium]